VVGPRNIIFIVADSLRYDSVTSGATGLPYVQAHAAAFSEARSAGCWTLPATASIFTGLLPHEHGATSQSRMLPPGLPTVAERLREAGWSTAQITANVATTDIFGLHRGFDEVERIWTMVRPDAARLEEFLALIARPRVRERLLSPRYLAGQLALDVSASKVWLQDTAEAIFDRARARIAATKRSGKQSFLFLNLMETHFPYHVGPRLETLGRGYAEGLSELYALFHLVNQTWMIDGERHFSDTMLQRLRARQRVAWLRLAPKIDQFVEELHRGGENLVVFLSDHGENFGEQGWLYHFSNVSDAGSRVPLYWLDPAGAPALHAAPVSTRFLHGALLHAAGLEGGSDALFTAPERAAAELEAFWYDNAGRTRPEYRMNQLCFIEGGERYRRRHAQGVSAEWSWAPRSGALGPEPRFERLPVGFDPVRERVTDRGRRAHLTKVVRGFDQRSAQLHP
jgi:hypothetical protein